MSAPRIEAPPSPHDDGSLFLVRALDLQFRAKMLFGEIQDSLAGKIARAYDAETVRDGNSIKFPALEELADAIVEASPLLSSPTMRLFVAFASRERAQTPERARFDAAVTRYAEHVVDKAVLRKAFVAMESGAK